jgi:uncharacterized membrane protein YjgN (DUF898 family)
MAEETSGKAPSAPNAAAEPIAHDTVVMSHDQPAASQVAPVGQASAPAPIQQTAKPATKTEEPENEGPPPLRFQFTGTGNEYFRIWVVNLLLTILTLGVYSAWAKVRRIQYFYRNTRLDGDVFDYHGNPKAILKGRVLALGLLVAYKIASEMSGVATLIVILILAGIMPWLLSRAFRFKLANTSYRGVRFRFQGTVKEAYQSLVLLPIVLVVTGLFVWSLATTYSKNPSILMAVLLGLLVLIVLFGTTPLAHYLLKRYQHDNAYFGQSPFFFYGKVADFFKIYGKAFAFVIIGSIAAALLGKIFLPLSNVLLASSLGWLFRILFGILGGYAAYLFARPYLESRIQNLVWNNTELGDNRFESTASARQLLWIHASNLLLIIVTLGLYKPFAAIRLAKYRLENLAWIVTDKLEDTYTDPEGDEAGATGQEAGEFFDIDIAI